MIYEQLVRRPETVLVALMEWLGEAFEAGQLAFNEFPNQRGLEDPKISHTSNVHTSSIHRWPTVLSREEISNIWQRTRTIWSLIDPEDSCGLCLDARADFPVNQGELDRPRPEPVAASAMTGANKSPVSPGEESFNCQYERMSAREINSERFDQAAGNSAGRVSKYIICSSQRTGSYLLCRQLINAGIGVPQEYFNPRHRKLLCRRWNLDVQDKQAYLHALYARRTTPNGAWGTKLHWRQYTNNRAALEQELLDGARYLFIYRTDVTAQAVSLHIALVTGIWGFDGVRTRPGRLDFHLGDVDHVAQCTWMIHRQNEAWRNFFAARQITPLDIPYEDFAADQQGFLRRIGRFLGLDPAAYRVPPPEERELQLPREIDAVKQELLRRCRPAASDGGGQTLDR